MRFSDSFLDEIRDRIPISEVIGQRVTFDKKKTNRARRDFWACCPFHGENTPSFHCEDKKGRYYCFGCGVSGDHFRFLTELDGLSFPEAVERLADMAGLPMPVMDRREQEREDKRASLLDAMEMATQYFEAQLQAPGGANARAYLRERGLSAQVQKAFRIGYAPDSRNALKQHLAAKAVTAEQMEACGLIISGEAIAVSYDRFRDRIMFPIPDARERVIAFGGRALNADVPAKYMNSPETELFHKSNVLYNYARARKAMHQAGSVIAAEGYMDVIALHAGGFANAVAPLGTALTERQMLLMWRLHPEPILCFDGDEAGLKAAWRAIDMLMPGLEPGRTARFAMMPEGVDPDDLIREEGPQAMGEVLDGALPLADMIWARETASGVFETPERRAELEARLRSIAGQIRHEGLRRHYDQDMRERLVDFFGATNMHSDMPTGQRRRFSGARRKIGRLSRRAKSKVAASPSLLNSSLLKKSSGTMPMREAALLAGIVNHPTILTRYFEEFVDMPLSSPAANAIRRQIVDACAELESGSGEIDAKSLRANLVEDGGGELLERMDSQLRKNGIWQAGVEAALEDALDGWRQAFTLHIRRHTLNRELHAAEQALASESSEENLERLLHIKAEIARDEGTEALIEGFGLPSGRPSRPF